MEVRNLETTYPQSLQDEVFDSCYYHYAVYKAVRDEPRADVINHIARGHFMRFLKLYHSLLSHEWTKVADGWALIFLSKRLADMWVPDAIYMISPQEVKSRREAMMKDWNNIVLAKMESQFGEFPQYH